SPYARSPMETFLKKPSSLVLCLALLSLSRPLPARAALSTELKALQDGFAEAAAKAKPAVVHITTVQEEVVRSPQFFFGDPEDLYEQFYGGRSPRPRRFRTEASGSGFVFDARGYVLTNDHVVHGANDIRVILTQADGVEKSYPGKLIGTDPYYDIAVVKIQG